MLPHHVRLGRSDGRVSSRSTGRLGSTLVVLSGARNEKGVFGRHFYLMENGRLKHLRSVEVEREFPQKLE